MIWVETIVQNEVAADNLSRFFTSSQEAISLRDASLPKIKVHATVVFSILNNFTRRTPRDSRVIGTLLGEVKDGVVHVSLSG